MNKFDLAAFMIFTAFVIATYAIYATYILSMMVVGHL